MFRPQTARHLSEFFNDIIKRWEQLTPEEKDSGEWINPDEPIVLSVPNPQFDGEPSEDEDAWGEPRRLLFPYGITRR
jgi:hypothetical protein